MTMFNIDQLPDVTGRNLGSDDKRWDVKARNINFTGTLSGAGLQNWVVSNPTANADTLLLSSDTGTGGMLERLRMRNEAGDDRVTTQFRNTLVNLGSPITAEGGMAPLQMFGAIGDTGNFLTCFRRASASFPALAINENGSIVSYASGIASAFFLFASGDAQAVMAIQGDGEIIWGPGGSGGQDVGLHRQSASQLGVTNVSGGLGNLVANQITAAVATGAPPFVVNSTTKVANLNAELLDGYDWQNPPPGFGSVTPGGGTFTSLAINGQAHFNAPQGTPPFTVNSNTPVDGLTVSRTLNCIHDGYINENGQAIKSVKVVTGNIAPGARAIVHIVFPTAFPSADFTACVTVFDSLNPTTLGLRMQRITAQDATFIDVQVGNDSVTEARNGVIHLMAFRTS